jgi:integrase
MRALEEAGYSSRTRQYAKAVLRRALRWAEQTGLVARNAAALVDGPKKSGTKLDDTLTAAEARAILDAAAADRLGALAVLVLSLGLRKGEALALRWPDIDLDAGELIVRGTLNAGKAPGSTSTRQRRRPAGGRYR